MPEINNSANVTYNFGSSENNLYATSNTLPINLETNQGLILTKTAQPTTFSAGSIITYTIQITNTSSHYLTGVRIIDYLGNGNLAYVVGSATLTSGSNTYPVTPVATNPLTFTLQQLAVGATMTLKYRSQVIFNLPSTVSQITNNVQGIGYTSNGTIKGFASSTITRNSSVDFSISKSSNLDTVLPSQNFNYYLTLTNNTSTAAAISSLVDNLPTNFRLTSVSLKIGNNPIITLSPSDYSLSVSNTFVLPSSTGPTITVPSNNSTVVTISGYFI